MLYNLKIKYPAVATSVIQLFILQYNVSKDGFGTKILKYTETCRLLFHLYDFAL